MKNSKKILSIILVLVLVAMLQAVIYANSSNEKSYEVSNETGGKAINHIEKEKIEKENSPKGIITGAKFGSIINGILNKNQKVKAPDDPKDTSENKVLIAYFSRSGTTKKVAEQIANYVNADIFQIEATNSYPSNYRETTSQAQDELNRNFRPTLTDTVTNMEEYDTIILGYPIWWGTTPMAVLTFLESYDFSGKTIAPFSTHEGSGLGSSVSDIKEILLGANIKDGMAIRNGNEDEDTLEDTIKQWVDSIEIKGNHEFAAN